MSERRLLRIGETEIPVAIDNEAVLVEDERLVVRPAGTGAWLVRTADGRSRMGHVAFGTDACWVHIDGAVFVVTIEGATQARTAPRAATAGELTAPMPATVISIVAPPGQTVRSGDPVLILEAMKMELPVRAPRDGTVTAVYCREGDLVQPGVSLAEIS